MKFKEVLERLKKSEERSLRKGFGGDATNAAFKRWVLILLLEIAKGKQRTPTAWNRFVSKYLKNGKSITEAAQDWQKMKKK